MISKNANQEKEVGVQITQHALTRYRQRCKKIAINKKVGAEMRKELALMFYAAQKIDGFKKHQISDTQYYQYGSVILVTSLHCKLGHPVVVTVLCHKEKLNECAARRFN